MADIVSIVIAVISLVGSILSASITSWVAYHNDKAKRVSESNALVAKYGDPLLLAALDLQSRLYNHLEADLGAYMRIGHPTESDVTNGGEARGQDEVHLPLTGHYYSGPPRYVCCCGDSAVRSSDHIRHIQMYHAPTARQPKEVSENTEYICCCNQRTTDPVEHVDHVKECRKKPLYSKTRGNWRASRHDDSEEYTSRQSVPRGDDVEESTCLHQMRKDLIIFYTLFTIGQYFSWTYILRRQVQFLRFSTDRHNKKLSDILWAIEQVFRSDEYGGLEGDRFMIWRGQQMAIGEIMTITEGEDNKELVCMGYSEFYSKFQGHSDDTFRMWFGPIIADIKWLTKLDTSSPIAFRRLIHLRHLLMDLMDFLDPEGSSKRRAKFALLRKPQNNYGCTCSLCGLKEGGY